MATLWTYYSEFTFPAFYGIDETYDYKNHEE